MYVCLHILLYLYMNYVSVRIQKQNAILQNIYYLYYIYICILFFILNILEHTYSKTYYTYEDIIIYVYQKNVKTMS